MSRLATILERQENIWASATINGKQVIVKQVEGVDHKLFWFLCKNFLNKPFAPILRREELFGELEAIGFDPERDIWYWYHPLTEDKEAEVYREEAKPHNAAIKTSDGSDW